MKAKRVLKKPALAAMKASRVLKKPALAKVAKVATTAKHAMKKQDSLKTTRHFGSGVFKSGEVALTSAMMYPSGGGWRPIACEKLRHLGQTIEGRSAGRNVHVVHNGGDLRAGDNRQPFRGPVVHVSAKKGFDFGADEQSYDDSDFESDVRRAINEYGDELQIFGLYSSKAAAQKAAVRACPSQGVPSVTAVPVFGGKVCSAVYVVKGAVYGQSQGACFLGAFTDFASAKARACQALYGVPDVWGDPGFDYDTPEYRERLQLAERHHKGTYSVLAHIPYGYMDMQFVATVEPHTTAM